MIRLPLTIFLMTALLLTSLCEISYAEDLGGARSEVMAGDRAYEAGEFSVAADHYAQALELGLDHADIHHNLGNARFKGDELGRATASYLRALRRDPRHAGARHNLMTVQAALRDEGLAPLSLPMFLRPLGWIYARVALNEWAALGLFFAFLSAAFGVFGQWGPIASARLRPALFACVVAGLISLSVCGIRYRADVLRESAVVVVDEVDVRSGPGSEYTLAFQIHEGLQVYVSQMRGEWRQIHLGGELVGWVEAAELEAL